MSESTTVPPIGTTNLDPGWREDLPMSGYLGDPAVSASKLWKSHDETPAHLLDDLEAEPGEDDTEAKGLGSVIHSAVFEAGSFHERYVVIGQCEAKKKGDGQRCTNAGKFWRDGQSFCGTRGHDPHDGAPMPDDIQVVQEHVRNTALAVKRALLAHPTASTLLTAPGKREATGVWQDPETGLWCRIRPDLLIEDPEGLDSAFHFSAVDLKSTGKSASPREYRFPRDFRTLGHYFKAAFYRMGLRELLDMEPQSFFYPVVETSKPSAAKVVVYRLNEDWLDIGEAQVREALNTLARCVDAGAFPGYDPEIHDLNAPEWERKQVHDIDFLQEVA